MISRTAAIVLCTLASASPALAAGDPIMPLDQVRAGMACTGASVVKGTDIATFAVRVDDVLGASDIRASRVLVTVSGPAVDATGVGPGFSGSPVSCPAADGTPLVIGAISETVGAYGGRTALVTPIQAILGEPVDPPQGSAPRSARARGILRAARPIAEPLSISGLSTPVGRVFERASRRAGRRLIAAPASPRQVVGAPSLRPGSAVTVSLATGDISAGAIGTVAYVDGDAVWAFGHPFDGVGRRELFLSAAYVFAVVSNPAATEEASTYKLAAPLANIGTLRQDGISAVVGRVGALPRSFPVRLNTRDLDTGRTGTLQVQVADERRVGTPAGVSALTIVAPAATAQAVYAAFGGSPVRQSDELCLRIAVRQSRKPLRFCNTYVGAGGGLESLIGGPIVADVSAATQILDLYDASNLDVTGVTADLRVRRGLRLASLARLSGPRAARRGSDVTVRASLTSPGGGKLTRTIKVHVPKGMPAGERDLLLEGTPPDGASGSGDAAEIDLSSLFEPADGPAAGPVSVKDLAMAIAGLHRYDGVTARFLPPGARVQSDLPGGAEGVAQRSRETYRERELRVAGSARLRITIRR